VIYWDEGAWTAYDTVTIANNVGGDYGGLLPTFLGFKSQYLLINPAAFSSVRE